MVNFIKRDKNDIYGIPVLGYIFKNQKFLLTLKIVLLVLFSYAIIFGFTNNTGDNLFTRGLFWGLFWPFFMVVSLSTLGRVFCGVCPHGFVGKYITKFGLKKKMPKSLENPFIGLILLFIGWWFVYYMFPGVYKTPFATALVFLILTIFAFVFFFIYSNMSYCKSLCPISAVTRGFSKIGFTWLGTYKEECNSCKTFDCAKACSYNLKPFTFDKKNSMEDCTLCMDCSSACEAVSFKLKKPSSSLFNKFKYKKSEVWAFILITGAITITMGFHHALGRSAIVEEFFWTKTARYFEGFINFGSIDTVGLFAFIYAMLIVLMLSIVGMFISSRIMKLSYEKTMYTLGFAFAPIFIVGGLSHIGEFFFYHYASDIVNGFIQAFYLNIEYMEPLATRKDKWVHIFNAFKYIAFIWAIIIMIGRLRLLDTSTIRKVIAFPFASALIIFYMGLNFYTGYVFKTYGAMKRGGHSHGSHTSEKMFQSVSFKEATLLQEGTNKVSGSVCGMNLLKSYKTNHSAVVKGKVKQYCSLHCLVEDLKVKNLVLEDIQVVDVKTLKFINANKASYVVGSSKKGTMTRTSKYAFKNLDDAKEFIHKYGGEIVSFENAVLKAILDFK